MTPKNTVVNFVDAICGSGKSTTLQHYIKTSLLKSSSAIPPRYLLVLPTHELCNQVKEELTSKEIRSYHVDVESGAVRFLISTLECNFEHSVIICTHECYKYYCYRAVYEKELQALLHNFKVFIDEIPDAMFGAYVKAMHTDKIADNFPFLKWMEVRDGLLFLREECQDDMYKYWHETQANGQELKQLLWAIMQGAGLLYEENQHMFAFTASPIIFSAIWAEQFTVLGAGSSRSLFVWSAENVMRLEVRSADNLLPISERRKHKAVPVKLLAAIRTRSTLTQLEHVFQSHLLELTHLVRGDFIYATNRDKNICDFTTIGDEILARSERGERVSMASYGLNHYQHIHGAVFLGCCNLDRDFQGKWRQYAELNGWNVEEFEQKQRAAMNYERCYQFITRTSIRNSDTDHPLVFVVPDLASAEYIKENYFPSATIECLDFDKPRKKRDTGKGERTRTEIQQLKAEGRTQKEVRELTGLSKGTVSQHWKEGANV